MEFRILGPLEVLDDDGRDIPLPAAKPRALLALLLLHRNRVVSQDMLVDELWEEHPPATAVKTLQVYVSQLRRALGDQRIETRPGGYLLHVEAGELDSEVFERHVAEKRWSDALGLWRGPAFVDVRGERFAVVAAERLEEARLAALEGRIDADLDAGRHTELVGELEQLADEHPVRERLRAQLMLALYRSGRQAEALEEYRRTRERLADELGLEPGVELRELEQAILRQDPALRRARPETVDGAERVRRPKRAWLALIPAAIAVAAVGSYLVSRPGHNDADLRAFAVKVENILGQAHDGRAAVMHAVDAALHCRTPVRDAAAQIDDVIVNRNSLLQQIAALNVPADDRARRSASLLQQAAAASFAADIAYRRDLLRAKGCPPRLRPASTANADRLKREFVSAFDPLAERFKLATWKASDF